MFWGLERKSHPLLVYYQRWFLILKSIVYYDVLNLWNTQHFLNIKIFGTFAMRFSYSATYRLQQRVWVLSSYALNLLSNKLKYNLHIVCIIHFRRTPRALRVNCVQINCYQIRWHIRHRQDCEVNTILCLQARFAVPSTHKRSAIFRRNNE